jgi:hypothetical protein
MSVDLRMVDALAALGVRTHAKVVPAGRGVNWRFTTEDARIKLKHLYPAIQG